MFLSQVQPQSKTQILMQQALIQQAKQLQAQQCALPFSIYSSIKEQQISNVPIHHPLLILVLSGSKKLGDNGQVCCTNGEFVFLSNHPNIDMRNIPDSEQYFALLIEFDYKDFQHLPHATQPSEKYVTGTIDAPLLTLTQQFIDLAGHSHIPEPLIQSRKQELLQFLYYSGYQAIRNLAQPPSLTQQIHQIISSDFAADWSAERLAKQLAISESTLRRKLGSEGIHLQTIKLRARLGNGLHLLQTTSQAIGLIAEQCGYQSQSRFTEQFKTLFAMTPSELRKTR